MADNQTTYNVLDLFCGCGGISKGFEMAGYNIIGGIDFNKDATLTFAKNFKKAEVICGDITEISDDVVTEKFQSVDIIVGGPPCQGFSSANRWQKEIDDPRNKLFFQYLRFVRILRPKALLIENVRGLLTRDNGYAKEQIIKLLTELGYFVSFTIEDASEYGVPQQRKRAVIVGIRSDYNSKPFDFSSIEKLPKVTVDEALSNLYHLDKMPEKEIWEEPKALTTFQQEIQDGMSILYDHEIKYPAEIVQKRISYVPQGGNWKDVPEELWPSNRQNRHSSAYKRLHQNKPSCTIDTGNAHSNYFHPLYNRIPSIRESARLQSFPDSFIFVGSRGSKYKQVGNAVPPFLARAIAKALKKHLENESN
jgi:DNA (cytosine-5)-methyltransferase 1